MSVLRIPVRVMEMLIVPTVTVRTAVLVNKDSLEMVQLVMVGDKVCFLSCVYVKPALDRVKIVKSPVIGARVCFVVCLLFSFDLSFHFRVLFLLLQLIHSTNFTAVIHFGH